MHFPTLALTLAALPALVLSVPLANSNYAPASPRDFHHPEKRVLDAGRRRFTRRKADVKRSGRGGCKAASNTTDTSNDSQNTYTYVSNATVTATATSTGTGNAQLIATGKSGGRGGSSSSSSSTDDSDSTASYTTTTTTTSQSSAPTSSAGGNELSSSGIATFFTQNGNPGNCGNYNSDSTFLIALATSQYNNGANCGKTVTITAANGVTQTATVQDSCPPCEAGHIDMSTGLWNSFGYPESAGIFDVTWECLDCTW